jgi:acyl dehydratase
MTRSSDRASLETQRWFENFHDGEVIELGARQVTREEIIAFATRWDPQPMHLEDAAGDASLLAGLSASGWHTGSLLMRMFCDNLLLNAASLGSPGVETLKWKKPVHPDDTLTARLTVLSTRASASRPQVGLVRGRFDVTNQRGETVMVMESTLMLRRREVA